MDEEDQWVAQLRKGSLELCMLALLMPKERYGYEIAQELIKTGELAVGEGTIYPLLSRLQREGKVSAEWRESPSGPPRKYYRITPEGRRLLEAKTRVWEVFSRAVNGILKEVLLDKPGS